MRSSAPFPLFEGIRTVHYADRAVFRIETARRGDVFMSVEDYRGSVERAVVIADAEKFLTVWRRSASSHREIALQSWDDWPKDYKFHHAESGFSKGATNPVPLARIGPRIVPERSERAGYRFFPWRRRPLFKDVRGLGFTDGITRTIWLLHFGARSFPVECRASEMQALSALLGTGGSNYATVDAIFRFGSKSSGEI